MTLDLEFMATCRGGLVKLRADCVKMRDKHKAPATKAHCQAIIDAIDARIFRQDQLVQRFAAIIRAIETARNVSLAK